MTSTTAAEFAAMEGGPLPDSVRRTILARRLPKAELHAHLTGSVRPSSSPLPRGPRLDGAYDYTGVSDFFAMLIRTAEGFDSARALTEATIRVLESSVDLGCRHVELTIQLNEFDRGPLTSLEVLDAAGAGLRELRHRIGLTGGLIVSTSRSHDAAEGVRTVETSARARDRGAPVLGIGNDGDFDHPLREYRAAYDRARAEGFRTTCHIDLPEDVADGLELGLDRIDHGYDLGPDDVARVRAAGIPLAMCPFGNFVAAPGKFSDPAEHPFERFRRAGLKVSLHTDDGAVYFTDIAQEYLHAATAFGWDDATTGAVALTSLESAWLDEPDRAALLEQWRAEIDALVTDPRDPAPALPPALRGTPAPAVAAETR